MRRSVPLLNLSSRDQLRAGKLPRRVVQLLVGLILYGVSMAMMLRATLGLNPWDVFHAGVTSRVPVTFGQVTIIVGALVLLLWVPLRQWPGLGTIANVVVIGLAVDAALAVIDSPSGLPAQLALLLAGLVLNGLAGGLYIGSQLGPGAVTGNQGHAMSHGPGPRDGLITGLALRTGLSIRLVRTGLELTVLGAGWLLGGPVGIGTVLYAMTIGPLVQFFLPRVTVSLEAPAARQPLSGAATPV